MLHFLHSDFFQVGKKMPFISFRSGKCLGFVQSEGHLWNGKNGSGNGAQGAGKSLPSFQPKAGISCSRVSGAQHRKRMRIAGTGFDRNTTFQSRDCKGCDQPRMPLHPCIHSLVLWEQGFLLLFHRAELQSCPDFPSFPVMDLMPEAQFSPFFFGLLPSQTPALLSHFPHHLPGFIAAAANIPGCGPSSLKPPIHLSKRKTNGFPPLQPILAPISQSIFYLTAAAKLPLLRTELGGSVG